MLSGSFIAYFGSVTNSAPEIVSQSGDKFPPIGDFVWFPARQRGCACTRRAGPGSGGALIDIWDCLHPGSPGLSDLPGTFCFDKHHSGAGWTLQPLQPLPTFVCLRCEP